VWVTEEVRPIAKNIYGVTKVAAEDLCELHHRLHGLACVILRTSRFFPEPDDNAAVRGTYDDANVKANEFLFRRVELQDVVDAHLLAVEKAPSIGFARYIVSATSPFRADDLAELRRDAPSVVARCVPAYVEEYARRGWKMFPSIERVYVNDRARRDLGWRPRYDFQRIVDDLRNGEGKRSALAEEVGSKGYHDTAFDDGPYPCRESRPAPSGTGELLYLVVELPLQCARRRADARRSIGAGGLATLGNDGQPKLRPVGRAGARRRDVRHDGNLDSM
jgi:Nucleoside-diphosphate-sugar epimerases